MRILSLLPRDPSGPGLSEDQTTPKPSRQRSRAGKEAWEKAVKRRECLLEALYRQGRNRPESRLLLRNSSSCDGERENEFV
jgi:hypothetical protein